jgi:uncharacterized membrane protein YhfC
MDILFVVHFLNGFLMIVMPVVLAICLTRQWKLGGRIWWIGVATFILSQVGHIPFNWGISKLLNQTGMVAWSPTTQLIFNAVFLGLSAGIFEEGMRYLVLRWWAKDVRSWRKGVLFGTGHGGVEAIILGAFVLYGFFQMAALRNTDLSKVIPANQIALVQIQVTTYWNLTWYGSLLGALERFFAIPTQIVLAVMVMQAFTRKHMHWLFLAIGYHALSDASAIISVKYLGTYWTEAIICGFAILSVILIFKLRQPEPALEIPPAGPDPVLSTPEPVGGTSEDMENMRPQ